MPETPTTKVPFYTEEQVEKIVRKIYEDRTDETVIKTITEKLNGILSALKLETPRSINDTPFDGTENIRLINSYNLSFGAISNVSYCIVAP